ncbi:MAG: glycosyltransferase [Bacteroidales bacterium]|nr:glycosyltransferase [Bacteroidales bacterium]
MHAPIVLFVYNRPSHTRRTLEALRLNGGASESVLHIFADGPKPDVSEEGLRRIAEVRDIISKSEGFREVHLHLAEQNKGLAQSVIDGVTQVVGEAGHVIVLEDDIETLPQFLPFMNQALDVYAHRKDIWTVGGMNVGIQLPADYTARHDLYLAHRTCTWGWATWADRWQDIDWEVKDFGKFIRNPRAVRRFDRGGEGMSSMLQAQMGGRIDSWAIRWDYHIYKHNGYCIRPVKSLCRNIGMDGSGTHYNEEGASDAQAPLFDPSRDTLRLEPWLRPDREVQRLFYNYWSDHPKLPFTTVVKRRMKKVLRSWGLMKQPQ